MDFTINDCHKSLRNLVKYSYTTNEFADLLLISIFELERFYKHFRIQICQNCGKYFFPTTAHKTLYCNNIFKNEKTCKEYASIAIYEKTMKNDPICKKYRNRYKNLCKEASYSNNPAIYELYTKYQIEGALYLEKYKLGKITAEEFKAWIDSMKIRK